MINDDQISTEDLDVSLVGYSHELIREVLQCIVDKKYDKSILALTSDRDVIYKNNGTCKILKVNVNGVDMILKNSKSNIMSEYLIGMEICEHIRQCPMFVNTYLYRHESDNTESMLLEYVDGILLSSWLSDTSVTIHDFINVYVQLIVAIRYMQLSLGGFTHYDLHTNNIILTRRTKETVITIKDKTYTFVYKYMPVMIDFGHSTSSRVRRTNALAKKHRIFSHPTKGYDAYIFILFCIEKSHYVLKKQLETLISPTNSIFYFANGQRLLGLDPVINLANGIQDIDPFTILNEIKKKYSPSIIIEKINIKEFESQQYYKPLCYEICEYFKKDVCKHHVSYNTITDMYSIIRCKAFCNKKYGKDVWTKITHNDTQYIKELLKTHNIFMIYKLYHVIILLACNSTPPYTDICKAIESRSGSSLLD